MEIFDDIWHCQSLEQIPYVIIGPKFGDVDHECLNSYSNSPNPPQIHSDPISRAKDITPSRPGPQRSSMLQLNFAAVDDPLVMTKIHRVSRWQVFAVSAVSSVLLGEIERACGVSSVIINSSFNG